LIISEDYKNLAEYSNRRLVTLSKIYSPVIAVTDNFGALICRVTNILGSTPPSSTQDIVVRDLMADAFDFLWEWRRPLLEGRAQVAYPLARRAFETISIMSISAQEPKFAESWEKGKEISNADVRKALTKAKFPEPEKEMKGFYKFFSKAAHPNRDLIAYRYLGDGNNFTLGSIGSPDLVLLTDHCIKLIQIWFWLTAVITFFYRMEIKKVDNMFPIDYVNTVEEGRKIIVSLSKELQQLLEKIKTEPNPAEPLGSRLVI
jgi:hypothetical protein